MSPWQMLPGQMSLWQLESVQDSHRNLRLKFGQNRVSNSWDITDIEFLWVGGVGWGGVCTVIFVSNLQLQLGWGYVVVELGFWQLYFSSLLWKVRLWISIILLDAIWYLQWSQENMFTLSILFQDWLSCDHGDHELNIRYFPRELPII